MKNEQKEVIYSLIEVLKADSEKLLRAAVLLVLLAPAVCDAGEGIKPPVGHVTLRDAISAAIAIAKMEPETRKACIVEEVWVEKRIDGKLVDGRWTYREVKEIKTKEAKK